LHFHRKLTHVNLLTKVSNIKIDGNIFEIVIIIIFLKCFFLIYENNILKFIFNIIISKKLK
jgi:hypothetical protein